MIRLKGVWVWSFAADAPNAIIGAGRSVVPRKRAALWGKRVGAGYCDA